MTRVYLEKRKSCGLQDLFRFFIGKKADFLSSESLKRNAEFVTILCQITRPNSFIFKEYNFFYQKLHKVLESFPQYYRLILSMAYDLSAVQDDLVTYDLLCEFVVSNQLIYAETSDMRRLESEYLLSLSIKNWTFPDLYLHERLEKIMSNRDLYFRPDRDLFYTLTHAVFYLTAFGRKPIFGDTQALEANLLTIGTHAYLSDDNDLLAEVCVCLHYLNSTIPPSWIGYVKKRFLNYSVGISDNENFKYPPYYHSFLVSCWCLGLCDVLPEIPVHDHECNTLFQSFPEVGANDKLHQVCFEVTQCEIIDINEVRRAIINFCNLVEDPRYAETALINPDFDRVLNHLSCGIFKSFNDIRY